MKTCGNCGYTEFKCCHGGKWKEQDASGCLYWIQGEPTELEKAQWWFCGWRNYAWHDEDSGLREEISTGRLIDAIRARAAEGRAK